MASKKLDRDSERRIGNSRRMHAKRAANYKARQPIDTSRRYTEKELAAMPTEDLTLLAYRMTYDREHGKRKPETD